MLSNFVVLGTPIDVLDASKIAPVPVSEVTVETPGNLVYPFPVKDMEIAAIGPYAVLAVSYTHLTLPTILRV